MKTRIFRFLILLAVLSGIYLLSSWYLLNGRLTYWTSFNPSSIPASMLEDVYVTDNLAVLTKGDSLSDWKTKFEIWTNTRYEIKYWGIIFHWTFHDSSWRYLNIEPKNRYIGSKWSRSKLYVNRKLRYDHLKNFSGGWEFCCNRIGCNRGDTVTIQFVRTAEKEIDLGTMSVVVE